MLKVGIVNKVSKMDILEFSVLIGVDLNAEHDGLINHGDKILRFNKGELLDCIDVDYFYFISFLEGFLLYENEGDPIYYYNFRTKETKLVANSNHFFIPTQIRSKTSICSMVEMDTDFNPTFYLFTEKLEKVLLAKSPKILLDSSYIFNDKSTVENYLFSELELNWRIDLEESEQLERGMQRNAVISDGKYVFIRLKDDKMRCVSIFNGEMVWEINSTDTSGFWSEVGDHLYVNFGKGFREIEKRTGTVTRTLFYQDIKELELFVSTGIIWCFDDLIITRNSSIGNLAIFDRQSFELKGYDIIGESGIPEIKNAVILQEGYLYVRTISNNVHIYKID